MGNALQFRPKTSKFQSYKCCACHYAFARGVHAPCDGLLTLRQNNSYYRLFPHSSFTQLESLMTAASSYPTETLFNILQTPSYAKLSKFQICNEHIVKTSSMKKAGLMRLSSFLFWEFLPGSSGKHSARLHHRRRGVVGYFWQIVLPTTTPTTPTIGTITTIALAQ